MEKNQYIDVQIWNRSLADAINTEDLKRARKLIEKMPERANLNERMGKDGWTFIHMIADLTYPGRKRKTMVTRDILDLMLRVPNNKGGFVQQIWNTVLVPSDGISLGMRFMMNDHMHLIVGIEDLYFSQGRLFSLQMDTVFMEKIKEYRKTIKK